ncbi:MAG: DUF1343 domain-containing protein [Flavobacteriales bacterium]|nr:DUF1343 domain-containing protein [Flavobacteriales bacterium]
MKTIGRDKPDLPGSSGRTIRRAMKCAKPMWCRANVALAVRHALILLVLLGCREQIPAQTASGTREIPASDPSIVTGAERTLNYVPQLLGKRIAVVTNQTGMIGATHLVDSLITLKVNVVKVFAPEHGFRGEADAGEHVANEGDKRTGLPLISLYGKNKKPTSDQLAEVDIVVFDIQDVGVRFYTFISTLHYVMEACAEEHRKLIVLDRPNPNGFYVDGPVLDTAYASFVGMHPVPIVYGMTIGEYARMINGEGWLKGKVKCELEVINCIGYSHSSFYALPTKPSPNLPNMASIYLYPSLGLFEGTSVSVGRGTDKPFQCIGLPGSSIGTYGFTPRSISGAKDPPYKDKPCKGMDLQEYGGFISRLQPVVHLQWLIGFYQASADKESFFVPFFDKLSGGKSLRKAIERGDPEEAIRASWKPGLDAFKRTRAKYLLYDDFR